MKNIIIMASGTGSNAEAIIDYFKNKKEVNISHILSNNPQARVLKMAKEKNIKSIAFGRKEFYQTDEILHFLEENDPDLIVLAGFLWIIPEKIVQAFPNKIINIHPSLLPKYGGKGMYGNKVHLAVLDHKEEETGISIHYVNELYDEGKLIAQFKTLIEPEDNLESVLAKIRKLEHTHYPKVIDQLLFA